MSLGCAKTKTLPSRALSFCLGLASFLPTLFDNDIAWILHHLLPEESIVSFTSSLKTIHLLQKLSTGISKMPYAYIYTYTYTYTYKYIYRLRDIIMTSSGGLHSPQIVAFSVSAKPASSGSDSVVVQRCPAYDGQETRECMNRERGLSKPSGLYPQGHTFQFTHFPSDPTKLKRIISWGSFHPQAWDTLQTWNLTLELNISITFLISAMVRI